MTITFESVALDSIIADQMGLSDAERQYLLSLGEELAIAYKLLNARNETLALIPECPMHGPQCQPHMREWIEKAKDELQWLRGIKAAVCSPNGRTYESAWMVIILRAWKDDNERRCGMVTTYSTWLRRMIDALEAEHDNHSRH